jgi:XisI protein
MAQRLGVDSGWDGDEQMNPTSVLMRIVNGKIWVEEDRTMVGFVDELREKGIGPHEIVLAFQPPKMRQYTQFAVA